MTNRLISKTIALRGAGDLATGVAIRLVRSGFRVVLSELPARSVSGGQLRSLTPHSAVKRESKTGAAAWRRTRKRFRSYGKMKSFRS